jgi:DNA polymerase-3 subunit beta
VKTTIDRKELLRALTLAARVAPKRSPKPILENVLLESNGRGRLVVTATNLELSSRTMLETIGDGAEWSALVSARALRDTLRYTKGDTLELSTVGGSPNLLIGGNATRPGAVLIGDIPEMYPSFPELPSDATGFDIAAPDFKRMIGEVRYAAAREESRYMINGVHVSLADDVLQLVATDGRRLAVSKLRVFAKDVAMAETVPLATTETLRMSIGKRDTMLSVQFAGPGLSQGASTVRFAFGDTVLVSQLLENNFPDYRCVMPKSASVSVTVDRKELLGAIARLRVHEEKDLPLVSFDACPDRLAVGIESPSGGSGCATLMPTGKGTGTGQIAFNPGYVLDGLKASDLPDVTLAFTDGATPATFDLGFTYVMMPIGEK